MTMKSAKDVQRIDQDKEEGEVNPESYFLTFNNLKEVPEDLEK